MRQIALDIETTGLSVEKGDRAIEFACIEIRNRRIMRNEDEKYHVYINPQYKISQEAFAIHGISNDFLHDKPTFPQVATDFVNHIKGAELIIHNATFDVGFLDAELQRAGLPVLEKHCAKIIDTLVLARDYFPGKRVNLDALCDRFEISRTNRILHGAKLDAELLAEVYIALTRGQDSLIGEDQLFGYTLESTVNRLSTLSLPIYQLTAEEQQGYEKILSEIDKVSHGKTLWRSLVGC
jgi:DNA polymerase-3 subunit epsilon